MKESQDYELVPSYQDEDSWSVRFLTGDYTETVVQYGALSINEDDVDVDGMSLSFNFEIVFSPDDSLSAEDIGLQEHAGVVLLAIIETAITNDEFVVKDKNDN
jgi:hypothetical protein